jgi:Glycosyl hydrolase family 71
MKLPFAMPSADVFLTSPKKVLAHYFEPYPIQIDNVAANVDYYNRNYLVPSGENNKFLAQGGLLRARPEAVTPLAGVNFAALNKQIEVEDAIAVGIGGFNYDILDSAASVANGSADCLSNTGKMWTLFQAAQEVNPLFQIVPTPDMGALVGATPAQIVQIIGGTPGAPSWIASHPSTARLPDGRIVISAFNALNTGATPPLTFWQAVIAGLDALDVDIAFIPLLLGSPTSSVLDPISLGYGNWGTAIPSVASGPASYMNGVLTQQFRPDQSVFWEASNSATWRNSWLASINGGKPYAQLITWNDMSESGMVRPYTDASLAPNIGTGFYETCAYYATYFVTGSPPLITNDVAYWFYRKMQSSAAHAKQSKPVAIQFSTEEANIELVGFLAEPGTLVINGQSMLAPANIPTSFKVPTAPGFPQFRLQRNGSDVFEFKGPVQIFGPGGDPVLQTQDLTYWSGSHSN